MQSAELQKNSCFRAGAQRVQQAPCSKYAVSTAKQQPLVSCRCTKSAASAVLVVCSQQSQTAAATVMQVYKESSKRALDEQYGGEDQSPLPAPGFTSPTMKFAKHSNAYMLVYVRESSWKDIMRDVSQHDIAEHVSSRLKVSPCNLLPEYVHCEPMHWPVRIVQKQQLHVPSAATQSSWS